MILINFASTKREEMAEGTVPESQFRFFPDGRHPLLNGGNHADFLRIMENNNFLNFSAGEQQLNLPGKIGEIVLDYLLSDEPAARAIRAHLCQSAGQTDSHGQPPVGQGDDGNSLPLTRLDEWMDNQDVMALLHVSARTLQTLRSNGSLPYAKMRGKVYYKQEDVQRLMEDAYRMGKIKNREAYGSGKL